MRAIFQRCLLAITMSAMFSLGVGQAWSAERVALLIGNGRYDQRPLVNPVRDAQALEVVLRNLGFDTTLVVDQGRDGLVRALNAFGDKARSAEVALVFFAGHGMQFGGTNYVIPVDATILRPEEVDLAALPLKRLLMPFGQGRTRVNILIVDACRDKSFANWLNTPTSGFAHQFEAPPETFIAFSTGAGTIADDGPGDHSPFAAALLRELPKPGKSLEAIFKSVGDAVKAATGNRQVPWTMASLTTDFSFRPGTGVPVQGTMVPADIVIAPSPSPTMESPASALPGAMERDMWEDVRDSNDPDDVTVFLQMFPNGYYSGRATRLLQKLVDQ